MIRFLLIFSLFLSFIPSNAQSTKYYEIADGDEHFAHGNYLMALPIYKEVLKREKDNASLNLKIAEY